MADVSRARVARIHLGLVLAIVICGSAFVVEIWRATSGNELSWAYVFEWPLLLAYSVYLWRRLLRDERGEAPRRRPAKVSEQDEEALAAWNDYLARLHASERAQGATGEPRTGEDAPHEETP